MSPNDHVPIEPENENLMLVKCDLRVTLQGTPSLGEEAPGVQKRVDLK